MVIVSSPPFSDELTGLDGTWTRRFLKKSRRPQTRRTWGFKGQGIFFILFFCLIKGAPDQSASWSGVSVCALAQVMVVALLISLRPELHHCESAFSWLFVVNSPLLPFTFHYCLSCNRRILNIQAKGYRPIGRVWSINGRR
jgi:hypothetical protein